MTTNDNIFKELALYDGTTINDRVYAYLGALGYTGTMNDRLAQLEEDDKKGWQALVALSTYADGTASLVKQLFGNGEQGAFFIPKPQVLGQQALYQDTAGTTPVTADGDPVGMMLDVRKGLVRGSELVTNGTFDAGLTGWTTGANVTSTIVDGEAEITLGGAITSSASNWFFPDTLIDQFSVYEIAFDATYISGGGHLQAGVSYNEMLRIDSTDNGGVRQRYTIRPVADSPAFNGRVTFGGPAGSVWKIDNVSVREFPGNHATQPTSAARPLYRTDGVLKPAEFDGVDDFLPSTYGSPVTAPCILSLGIDRIDTTASRVIATGAGASDRHQLSISSGGSLVGAVSGTALTGTPLPLGKHVITLVVNGSFSELRVDGVVVASGALPNDSASALTLGALWDGTAAINMNLFGAVHVEGVGGLSDIESYLASLTGVTL